jgi:hypothetical protein
MSFNNAAELFKELSKVWSDSEPKAPFKIIRVQVKLLDGSLRWIEDFGLSDNDEFILSLSSDRPAADIMAFDLMQYIAVRIKESMCADGQHSYAVFGHPVRTNLGLRLRNLYVEEGFVILTA